MFEKDCKNTGHETYIKKDSEKLKIIERKHRNNHYIRCGERIAIRSKEGPERNKSNDSDEDELMSMSVETRLGF